MTLRNFLADPRGYRDQIDRLHVKFAHRGLLYELTQDGVPFASIVFNREKVARILAKEVSSGKYELQPAETRLIEVNGKSRQLYVFCLTDRIVHGVVASIVCNRMEAGISRHLYSYRRGLTWLSGITNFARYVRGHRRCIPDPRSRGLYVLRRDIRKYTDSIPVDKGSPIWPMLWDALALDGERKHIRRRYCGLIQEIVRPDIVSQEGLLYKNICGVPTGSAISTVLFNMYLGTLDDELGNLHGGFYARYSDDILFAHPDPDIARLADERISAVLRTHRLGTNEDKDENLYFNGAGRPSPAWHTSQGTTSVSFLGCNISFDGTITLKGSKVQRLLADLGVRIHRTLKAIPDRSPAVAGPILCGVINEALNPRSPLSQKSAPLLRSTVTCRSQLRQLDYEIARLVAGALTGQRGPRAFRKVPYRRIRGDWRLTSLVHTRNVGPIRASRDVRRR
ncbi:MAG: reverse transcriptase domain-containing protein [Pseudomonadota bacterium]